ncbi:hypothetical protein HELRODRAFT_178608 [Helobdella robusta]|uniref:Endonuclease/exonuclease/phosphatase domain-containing protein n=1 Tax=Helobdella robusta TaxID=6412 RepID=T1FDG1_HELRO|nr:hypothetical protein HELRODRAFT_178608 [Helobdella robusta]ESN96812.1 hypothetical protein HELRODRAFT_178608 [Helobdella robusta]
MKMKFTIGSLNVRSLWQAGTYAMLKKELERFRFHVIGTETEHIHGVGMILGKQIRKALMEYNPVKDRFMYARFKRYPRGIIVIVAYAPTTNYSDDEVETFLEQMEQTFKALLKKDVKIIVGD